MDISDLKNNPYLSTEIREMDGKKITVFKLDFYHTLTWVIGRQFSTFLQETESIIVPTEPYRPTIPELTVEFISKTFKESPYLPPSLKDINDISETVRVKVDVLCSIIYQVVNALPKFAFSDPRFGHAELAFTNDFFGLHDSKYTIKHVENVLHELDPDLSKTVHFQLEFGEVPGTIESSTVKLNHIDDKTFYSAWLIAIKNHLANTPFGQSRYFEKFRNVFMSADHPNDPFEGAKFSNIRNKDLGINENDFVIDEDQGINDLELRKKVNEALLHAFGYPALMALKSGLMTFSKDVNGNFDVHLITHSYLILNEFLNDLHINVPTTTKIFTKRQMDKKEEIIKVFSPLLLSSCIEYLYVKIIKENEVNLKPYAIHTHAPISSSILTGLFDNIRISKNQNYHSDLRRAFLTHFYEKYDSADIQSNFFKKGKQILKARINQMIKDQVNLVPDDVFDSERYFKGEIDIMLKIATERGETITRNELIKLKKEQVINYLTNNYIDKIYYPTLNPTLENPRRSGDFAQWFQDLITDPVMLLIEIPFATSRISTMNQFFKEFNLKFCKSYFSESDIINILPSLAYKRSQIRSGENRIKSDEIIEGLYSIKDIMPEIKEKIDNTHYLFLDYFDNYIKNTPGWNGGVDHRFTIQFIKEKPMGFGPASYLRDIITKTRVPDRTEIIGKELTFKVVDEQDLNEMVSNIVYYMIKYDCIATVREVQRTLGGDIEEKYALIASTSGLKSNDYLRYGYEGQGKNDDLYLEMSNFAQNQIYLTMDEDLKEIWEPTSIYPIYLLKDHHLLKEFFINAYGNNDPVFIRNLMQFSRRESNWDIILFLIG